MLALACIAVLQAGEIVRQHSHNLMLMQVTSRIVANSRYVAETFSEYLNNLNGIVEVASQIVQDRIVNYPYPGWEEDKYVPFLDMETRTNMYPLKSMLLPMDWQVLNNVNESNMNEHLQERSQYIKGFIPVSSRPSYFMQGACDPNITNSTDKFYCASCTNANNDWHTGGVVQPTPVHEGLYKKAADLGVLLKPLYEAQDDVFVAGIFFMNAGAGSAVIYPGPGEMWGAMAHGYVSDGCDWMHEMNPHARKPFGTEREIARCHPAGTVVLPREYNPMERKWCQNLALTSKVQWSGPINHTDSDLQVHRIGKAVFDRMSGELIACLSFGVGKVNIDKILQHSKIHCSAQRAVIWYKDNTVLTTSLTKTVGDHQSITSTGFISVDILNQLRQGVNRFGNWTSKQGKNSADENVVLADDGILYTAYPVPVQPNEPDDSYEPLFLVINSIDLNSACSSPDRLEDDVADGIKSICIACGLVGFVGMIFIVIVLWFVSSSLTQPLLWMKQVSWSIVNHNDKGLAEKCRYDGHPFTTVYRPRTEISELVEEFQSMIEGFSGDGPASIASEDQFEILNQLTWQSDFQNLYSLHEGQRQRSTGNKLLSYRTNPDNESNSSSSRQSRGTETSRAITLPVSVCTVPAPAKKHIGMNTRVSTKMELHDRQGDTAPYRTSLFWWVLCLIVAPLLLTSVVISSFTFSKINHSLSSWILSAQQYSSTVEAKSFCSASRLKAIQANTIIDSILRDLHLLSRMAGWLLFDGVNRSAAFTHLEQATQECRNYTYGGESMCPFLSDIIRAPCACQWEDSHPKTVCHEYNQSITYPRALQNRYFMSQKRDFNPVTGDRNRAESFGVPGVDDSGATTLWWDNFNELPGSNKGATASGYQTAYDRARVASAMAVVEIPIYNHAISVKHAEKDANSMLAFEADGMATGYVGCNHQFYGLAGSFQSNNINKAAEFAPELCPLGKFGYDPRCREWYSMGKQLYEKKKQTVYVSEPFLSAIDQSIMTSATAAVVNPSTNEYAGQINLDFVPKALQSLFDTIEEGATAFVMGPHKEVFVTNKQGFDGWNTTTIGNLLLPFDDESTPFRVEFERSIIQYMMTATNFTGNFSRTSPEGLPEICLVVSHTVKARSLAPIDPSDFSRGCTVNDGQVIYIVGIAYPEHYRKKPWEVALHEVEAHLRPIQISYISVVVISVIAFVVVSFRITQLVTNPVITLLLIVRMINNRTLEDEIPPLKGGSTETNQVYSSFAKLNRIVRLSNSAYFSGKPERAYGFLHEALKLYRNLNDSKAIGVASNNLANALLELIKTAKGDGECCRTLDGLCIVKEALRHYEEAIRIAELQLANAPDDIHKTALYEQLADRIFNRSLFLLIVSGKRCAPIDARNASLACLAYVRQLDHDVKVAWLKLDRFTEHTPEIFTRTVKRCVGLLDFYSDKEVRSVWEARELVKECDQLIHAEMRNPGSKLFDEINYVGRLQQLECLAMHLAYRRGRKKEAACFAMRILTEDEYILASAFKTSANMLLSAMRDPESPLAWSAKTTSSVRADLRMMLRDCQKTSLEVGICLLYALEINEQWEGSDLLDRVNACCLELYDDCVLADDYMGIAAYTTLGDLSEPLRVKAHNAIRQRNMLDMATSSTSENICPSFPYAVQMLNDSSASLECDSYILLILDGYSWNEGNTSASLKAQLERMNQGETKTHVFILGMGVEDPDVKEECQDICTVSKKSFYMDIDLDNVDSAFEFVRTRIQGHTKRDNFGRGTIMEKF